MTVRQRIVFVLAPARSGSTVLQRLLMTSPDVRSASEPWFLLPLMSTLGIEGFRGVHENIQYIKAGRDLEALLRSRDSSLRHAIQEYAHYVYGVIGDDTRVIVDKTPRYLLIAPYLYELFPEALFVVMWRNPLDVVRSILYTWLDGRWKLGNFYVDLFDCQLSLQRLQHERDRTCVIRYEDLVSRPDEIATTLEGFLGVSGLSYDRMWAARESLEGRMGDPLPAKGIGARPLDDAVLTSSFVRRSWCESYIDWIGVRTLRTAGYDPDQLRSRVSKGSEATLAADLVDSAVDLVKRWVEPVHFREMWGRRGAGLPAVRCR